MAATATQDEDLLIIADDNSESDSSDIDFSFDFGDEADTATVVEEAKIEEVIEKVTEADTDTLDILSEEISPEAPTSIEETKIEDAGTSEEVSFDLGLDLSEDTTTEEVSETSEAKTEEVSFDLGLTEEVSENSVVEESSVSDTSTGGGSTGDDSSMNDILSVTIAKLAARKTNIASQKDEKLKHEDEIQSQIQALQNEHSTIEQELAGLDSESEKITKNISELEDMKLDPVKEHNAKRVAKKK